ncbi:DUF1345 domain-containing protein [Fodinicola feengrottensis]|uniref:DUF1345 domain-containing protein n=1 Tax=Fodinicola feengrottensis TaxID=435914 RepID=A0ABN2J8D4_9ACTN|nr:DUF1345 domain-containing protein [Fodinicola feengrottensis]
MTTEVARTSTVTARVRVMVAAAAGIVAGALCTTAFGWRYAILVGWMCAAAVFVGWVWITIWPMDGPSTRKHAIAEDPGRTLTDLLVVGAALASLAAVGLLLLATSTGSQKDIQAGLSVCSVALSWLSVHTVFTTRYARIHYSDHAHGVDFNEDDDARYSDFAYLAFTIGMTFQVSDTDLTTKNIRRTALRHALISYVLGAVVIAATINLVVGLANN